ncbi:MULTISPECIES: hypothetical protein [unclassified Streptomyces]
MREVLRRAGGYDAEYCLDDVAGQRGPESRIAALPTCHGGENRKL